MAVTRIARYLAVAWLALAAATAAADSKEAYKLGVEAVEAGRWNDAARFFRAAIAERPEEKITRFLKTEYLPHFYLGVAAAEQGDCRAALAAWEESLKQGQIERSKLAGELESRRQRCQAHLRQVDSAIAEAEGLLARGGEAEGSLAALARSTELAPLWDQGEPSPGDRQQAAAERLAEARRSFDVGRAAADLDRLDAAKSLAQQALDDFHAATGAARERRRALDAATASAVERLEDAEQNGLRTLRSVQDLAPYPSKLGQRVAAVQRVLQRITDAKGDAGPQMLDDLGQELAAAVAALERAARRPPARLADAVEAFLAGAYEEAIGRLEDESLAADARARPHVCLLLAASRHALWVLGGRSDQALIDLAAQDLAACADAEALTPSPRFFSPRFVEFHDATLRTPAADPAGDLSEGGAEAKSPAGSADDR